MDNPIHNIFDPTNPDSSSMRSRILTELKGNPRFVCGMGVVLRMANFLRFELNYCFPFKTQLGDHFKSGFTFGFGIYYM